MFATLIVHVTLISRFFREISVEIEVCWMYVQFLLKSCSIIVIKH